MLRQNLKNLYSSLPNTTPRKFNVVVPRALNMKKAVPNA